MRARALLLGLLSSVACAEPPAGGGGLPHPATDELTLAQRARIDAQLVRNVAELERASVITSTPPLLAPQQGGLQWPLRVAASYADPG